MDGDALRSIFASFRPELVIHLAAKTVLDERANLTHFAANIQGVQNMIDAIQSAGSVERTFFASSRLVCRLGYMPKGDIDYQPSTLYGLSKVRGEQLVRAAPSGLGTWTILRPTGIWGPWFGAPYRDFFNSIRHGRYVHPPAETRTSQTDTWRTPSISFNGSPLVLLTMSTEGRSW